MLANKQLVRIINKRCFTSWWASYVEGRNPDDWPRADTASFFRAQGLDPLKMKKELLDDYRRFYLTEMNWHAEKPEAPREEKRQAAFQRLAAKRFVQLEELRSQKSRQI